MADLTYDDVVKIVADEAWGACEACRADPRAILRALSAAGIALVPREATGRMLFAAQNAIAIGPQFEGSALARQEQKMRLRYAAMLAAGEIREKSGG